MAVIKTKEAWFFDEKGDWHGKKHFSKHSKTITYGKGSYNIDFKRMSYKRVVMLPGLWEKRVYFYNTSNSNPILIDKKSEPIMSPELYDIQLKTKVARELNDLANEGLLSKILTPKNIAIGIVLIVVIWFISSGQKLF